MLLNAIFLNPGGPPLAVIALGIAVVGFAVGLGWIWRISSLGEDTNRSSFRYRRRR